jgi:hypothetical protein
MATTGATRLVGPQNRPSVREDDVVRDFSQLFCPARSEKSRKTLFWLPASDEQIAKNERDYAEHGFPVVKPNAEFTRFLQTARPLDRKESNQP